MKAMIFAAGLAKRLQPFSDHTPKALVKVGGKTMFQRVAEKLILAGATEVVVNIHHHPKKIRDFILSLDYPGVRFMISDESSQLLDTGGGLLKAADWLTGNQPVLLHNVDILSNIDLKNMLSHHRKTDALATLAVASRKTSRYFLWNEELLAGWENTQTGETILCDDVSPEKLNRMAFSGIHIIQPKLFDLITEQGVFSINRVYLRLASQYPIRAYIHDPKFWADTGTIKKLQKAEQLFTDNPDIF